MNTAAVFVKIAAASIGAFAVVLVLTAVILMTTHPGPGAGLAVVLGGMLLALAALGVVSTFMTRRLVDRAPDEHPHRDEPR